MLTDLVVPDFEGDEIALKIREEIPDLRVLFMSGYTQDRELRAGGKVVLDEDNFLQKPFSTELLARKVRTILDGE